MKPKEGILGFGLILFFVFPLFGEIRINGLFRNDFTLVGGTNRIKMSDIVENRFILSRRTEDWRFYADARLYLLYGEAAQFPINFTLPPLMSNMSPIQISTNVDLPISLSLMRAFVRFYSVAGDFTLGKTYINFGKKGVFNPFEMNKSVNFSDLAYDREGILALEWENGWGDIEARTYVSPVKEWTNSAGGFSLETHLGTFDIGTVYNRKRYNRNIAGLYFQGDLEVGVHGAWAYHCDDYGTHHFHEVNFGVDYSFLKGKLIVALDGYFTDAGATNTNDYMSISDEDRFLQSQTYLYGNLSYVPDEFLSAQLISFINVIDGSVLLTPIVKYTLFDGLDVTVQAGIPFGTAGSEFDPKVLGSWSGDLRLEAKL